MAAQEGKIVRITSRDRVIFPDAGFTKGELADYYALAAPLMLPFMAGRPLSLVRCPQGRAKKCFYQKHDTGGFGPHVHSIPITEKEGDTEPYLYVEDAAGILGCVQMGTIEFHAWPSRCTDLEAPDRLVIDLDPDAGLDFAEVKRAAFAIRARLAETGLASFALLTGGKGVHVIAPFAAGPSWEELRDFARALATDLAEAEPARFTATMSKAKRKGKIFIDCLRNQRGNTAVLPYSARARSGAPVAVPIAWDKLDAAPSAHPFSIADIEMLLRRAQHESLADWGMAEQEFPRG